MEVAARKRPGCASRAISHFTGGGMSGGGTVHVGFRERSRSPAWGSPSSFPFPRWFGLRHLGHGGAAASASRPSPPLGLLRFPKRVWKAGGRSERPGGGEGGERSERGAAGRWVGATGAGGRAAGGNGAGLARPPFPRSFGGAPGAGGCLLTQILPRREAGAGGGEPVATEALRSQVRDKGGGGRLCAAAARRLGAGAGRGGACSPSSPVSRAAR